MKGRVERASFEDLKEILVLQKRAFKSESIIYQDDKLPPLVQTIEDIQNEFKERIFLKYVEDNNIIGSVRGHIGSNCEAYVGRLIVDTDHQRKGIGTLLMKKIEECFSECNYIEIFTGNKSKQNISFYKKLLYTPVDKSGIAGSATLSYLQKKIK